MKNYKVFAINPGSTSTKIAMFEGEKEIFSRNISHDAEKLKEFKEISDQLPYRKEMILNVLKEEGQTLEGVDAFSARGGGLVNVEGGVFTIGDKLLEHARTCYTVKHPATLGAQLADAFSKEFGGVAFVVNPPDVDEFQDVARVTGLKGVYRESRIHALNQKEIGIRFAAKQGKKYEDMNLIICHIGGGISVTAHRMGKMVDSNDIANGDVVNKGFHVLRRTFATTLLRNNAGIQMVMDSLGHTDNTSVMKYLSFDEKKMRLCPLSLTQYSLLLEGGAK